MKKVTIGVVLYGTKYLAQSLKSLINQDYPEVEYIFRDQEEGKYSASEFIGKNLPEVNAKARVIKGKNIYHSGGHNAIINQMSGDYYFCCSNDMLYPPDFVSKVVEAMEKNPDFSFATCKIKRWDYENDKKTNIIDSFGIGATEYHHFYDIGQGEEDEGQYEYLENIFGTSGALSVFTREALQLIRRNDEYFDEAIHYKNDVDLSYRLNLAGEKAMLIQNVTVFHDRQTDSSSKKSAWVKRSSFIGEKILMKKNFSKTLPFRVRLKTRIYHFLKTTYLLIRNPSLITAYKEIKEALSKG